MSDTSKVNELNLLRQDKKWPEVETLAREMLENEPESVFYLKALEQGLRFQDKKDDLPDIWGTLVDQAHEDFPYAQFLASWLNGEGRGNEAVPYYRQAIEGALKVKELDSIQEMCLELLDLDPHRLDYYIGLSDRLEARKEKSVAADILELLLDHHKGLNLEASLLPIVHRLAKHRSKNDKFRAEAVRVYRSLYRDRPDLSLLIDGSGLSGTTSIPEAMEKLESLLRFGADQYVYHFDWGIGQVLRLDPRSLEVTIRFDKKDSHRVSFELAEKILDPLAKDDLRVLMAANPDEVERLKTEDPMALIYAAIRSCGGQAKQKEIKEAILQKAMTEKEWSTWWAKIGKSLVTDPRLAVSGTGVSKVYALRDEEIRFEDETRVEFDALRDPSARVDALLRYMEHCTEYGSDESLLRHISDSLSRTAEKASDSVIKAEIVLALFGLWDKYPQVKGPCTVDPYDLASDLDLGARILEGLRLVEHEEKWVEVLRKAHPDDWPKTFADLLLSPYVVVRDLLADSLVVTDAGKDLLVQAFHTVSSAPRTYPGPAIWFCERGITHRDEAGLFHTSPAHLLERILRLLDHLSYAGRQAKGKPGAEIRAHAAEIRAFLRRSSFQVVKDAIKDADITTAESIRKSVNKNIGLDPGAQGEILKIIHSEFRGMALVIEDVEPIPEEGVVAEFLCTLRGLDNKKEELRKLVEEDIPANAKDLEIAKGHGDLSENAEYQYAKERQSFLGGRLRELQTMLSRARPMDLREVVNDSVRFGTRVAYRAVQTGEEMAYTILGPWESKPEENTISYLSPMGAAMLGKKVGETVKIEGFQVSVPTEYEIVSISKVV